jgi:SAM-dependent methyltransferase
MNARIPASVLESEQRFFDREAAQLREEELLIPADQIERYQRARPSALNIPKDTLFARLLPLEGMRVLDYGCGMGENVCLLAACGARVTGFDLSPRAIERAQQRARLQGVADRVQLDIRAAGATGYPDARFDVVTGFGILHHIHQELPRVFEEVARVLTPGGVACFIEPVANSAFFRGLRRVLPVPCDATPDERQLRYRDFEPLHRHFTKIEYAHYYCLERLHRLLGGRCRRPLRWLDYHAQRLLPFLRRYYGALLVIAHR